MEVSPRLARGRRRSAKGPGTPDRARGVRRRAEPAGVSKRLPLKEPTLFVASGVSPCLVLKHSKSVVCSWLLLGRFCESLLGYSARPFREEGLCSAIVASVSVCRV